MDNRKLAASLAASIFSASSALAATLPDASKARIATDYSAWAGGRDNAEALVSGLHRGTSITLSTYAGGNAVSLAGFTPNGPMSYVDVNAALARARADLMRLGVRQPTAEQIQAALIGGDVHLSNGRTRSLRGTVPVLGGNNYATR
jgi:hypothetical protein